MNHWPQSTLGDVVIAKSGNGKIIKGTLPTENDGRLFPAYSATGQDVFSEEYDHEGDGIVVSAVGARCGKCFLAEGKWRAIANTHVLLPRKDKISPRFLWYLINDETFWIKGGSAQPFVKMTDSLRNPVPVPPLSEQERIVRILDGADGLRQRRRQADDRARQFPLALFRKMFGEPSLNSAKWPVRVFEELVSSSQLGLVRGADEMGEDKAFAYLRMDSILGNGRLRTNSLKRVDATEKDVRNYALQPDDFLFNTRNSRELVGKTAIFSGSNEVVLFNNNIMRIRFSEVINPHYLLWLFQTPLLQNELEQRKSGTTSVVAIYWKALKTIPILLPPIELQNDFAAHVEKIHSLETAQSVCRLRLDELFRSLLYRAFQGEL